MINQEISIRQIQHFLYCPHRWGLLEIDCAWAENVFVTKANLLHHRVHDSKNSYSYNGKKTFTSVSVYNDLPEYNLYGVTDCIEVNNGIYTIVEYKPTKPKNIDYNFDDLMQVFAQKICVDLIFNCDCNGIIYYADVKKRTELPLRENFAEYDKLLKNILSEMRSYFSSGKIPAIKKGQKCNGCSMKDLCMPKVRLKGNVRDNIRLLLEDDL